MFLFKTMLEKCCIMEQIEIIWMSCNLLTGFISAASWQLRRPWPYSDVPWPSETLSTKPTASWNATSPSVEWNSCCRHWRIKYHNVSLCLGKGSTVHCVLLSMIARDKWQNWLVTNFQLCGTAEFLPIIDTMQPRCRLVQPLNKLKMFECGIKSAPLSAAESKFAGSKFVTLLLLLYAVANDSCTLNTCCRIEN